MTAPLFLSLDDVRVVARAVRSRQVSLEAVAAADRILAELDKPRPIVATWTVEGEEEGEPR